MGNDKLANSLKDQYSFLFPTHKASSKVAKAVPVTVPNKKDIPAIDQLTLKIPKLSLFSLSLQKTLLKSKDLRLGSRDISVKALQKFLNTHNFLIAKAGAGSLGQETSYFGKATRVALIKFQQANSLSATGLFDAKTRAKVGEMVNAK